MKWTPAQLRYLLDKRTLTTTEIAAAAGSSEEAVRKWLNGRSRPMRVFRQNLTKKLGHLIPASLGGKPKQKAGVGL